MNVDPADPMSEDEDEEDEFHYDMEEDGQRLICFKLIYWF